MEPHRNRGGEWIGDLLSGLLDPDGIGLLIDIVRIVGHGLMIVGRVVFHLLTCHFY